MLVCVVYLQGTFGLKFLFRLCNVVQVCAEVQVFGKDPKYSDKHLHPVVKQVRCFSGQLCPELKFHKVLDLDEWKPIALDSNVGMYLLGVVQ